MRARSLIPVFLALLMLLGPFGHVIPSTDSGGREGQSEGLGEPFDDLTLAQQHALDDSPVLSHVSVRNAEQTEDVQMDWEWAVRVGGSFGAGIAVDSSGNAYVTGGFAGAATFGSTSLISSGEHDGSRDIFVAKLSSSGSWQWAVKAGGSDTERGYGIAVDSSGNAYVTGVFRGTATFGSTTLNNSGSLELFIAKLSSGSKETESSWAELLNIALIIVSIIFVAGASIVLWKRSRRKNEIQTTKLAEGMPLRPESLLSQDSNPLLHPPPQYPTRDHTFASPAPVAPVIQGSLASPAVIAGPQSGHSNLGPPPAQPVLPAIPDMYAQPAPLPSANWKGVWGEDGYERLEHPQGSGVWYWRDQQTGQWVKY